MPENTPIYGFTYPCNSDPISFTSIATLANQIDTKMASIQLDANYATGRYSSRTASTLQAGVAAGVETTLVNPGASYVVPADGIYWAMACVVIIGAASITSSRMRLYRNGVLIAGRTWNAITAATNAPTVPVFGAMTAAAGDTITVTATYFGVGPAGVHLNDLHVRQIVRTF